MTHSSVAGRFRLSIALTVAVGGGLSRDPFLTVSGLFLSLLLPILLFLMFCIIE